jgi:hypothetical protein
MTFPAVRLGGLFPELSGFVLLDAARLDDALGGDATGQNLLHTFTTTDHGDEVTRDGIALPVLGVDAGYYTVIVRHARDRSRWPTPQLVADGWVLGTETGSLVLCGVGYLVDWNADHPRHRHVAVPPGWYEVQVRGYLLPEHDPDDAAYEFVLAPTRVQPRFHGQLDQRFGLITTDGRI